MSEDRQETPRGINHKMHKKPKSRKPPPLSSLFPLERNDFASSRSEATVADRIELEDTLSRGM